MVKETREYSFNNKNKTLKIATRCGVEEYSAQEAVVIYKELCDEYERDTSEDGGKQQMRSQIS